MMQLAPTLMNNGDKRLTSYVSDRTAKSDPISLATRIPSFSTRNTVSGFRPRCMIPLPWRNLKNISTVRRVVYRDAKIAHVRSIQTCAATCAIWGTVKSRPVTNPVTKSKMDPIEPSTTKSTEKD